MCRSSLRALLPSRHGSSRITRASASRCLRPWSSHVRATTPIWQSGRRRRHSRPCASMARVCRQHSGLGSPASRSTRSNCRWRRSTLTRRLTPLYIKRWRVPSTSAKASCTCWARSPTRSPYSRPNARARHAGAVSRSWILACSHLTPSTAGVRAATGRAWRWRALTRSKAAKRSGGTSGTSMSPSRAAHAKAAD